MKIEGGGNAYVTQNILFKTILCTVIIASPALGNLVLLLYYY